LEWPGGCSSPDRGHTSSPIPTGTLEKFTTFGDLLRFLRRRVGISQVELSLAVGYSNAQISRLEQNLRPPDLPTIEARFVGALALEDEPKAVARLLELAANVRREDAPSAGLCPYKGLTYFDESDADLFVGREALVSKLLEYILALEGDKEPAASRFLAIVGASGSGKSSLVRAGVVPALRWHQTSANWPIHVLTPTAHPVESLAVNLAENAASVAATAVLIDDLMRDPRSLHLHVGRLLKGSGAAHLLLAIDQFEELFTLCQSEDERTAFVGNLLTACSSPDGPTILVIALRADFYAHCAGYPRLREALAHHQEFIGGMSTEELRRAIEEPARRGHWGFEAGLVDLLLHDVGREPGALPLLSHALLETWDRRRGHTLTLGGYASSGGVRGAIAETAEALFTEQLSRAEQGIARRIFLRLTALGDEAGTGDSRRRATFDELMSNSAEADATRAVLKALADARLITVTQDAAEVAHEALIREWPTLRGWLEENREGLRLHRSLADAALEWAGLDREADVLYRGARLSQVREWAVANADELNPLEREFLDASSAAAERQAAEKEARRQHELEAAQKLAAAESARAEEQLRASNRLRGRNRTLRLVGALAVLLAVTAGTLALLAGRNAQRAGRNLNVAEANFARAESLRLAAEADALLAKGGDPQAAALLSIRALESTYSPQADAALFSSLKQVYNRQIFRGHTTSIYSVAISPDGKYALTGSQDGSAREWEVSTGKEVRRFDGHTGGIASVAFSPDGRYVLTGGNDQTVRMWDAANGAQLRLLARTADSVSSVAFSPDGTYVLAAGGRTAQLWDAGSGQLVRSFIGHDDFVSAAVFSRDGEYVLTGSYDNTARLWDAGTGEAIRTFSVSDTGFFGRHVTSVAFSPDGRYVAAGSDDRSAHLWDAVSGLPICSFSGHAATVNAVAFSPDGQYLVTGGDDNAARVWRVRGCQAVRQYVGLPAGIKSAVFSPDGQSILAAGQDGTGWLWASPAATPLRTFVSAAPGARVLIYDYGGTSLMTTSGVTSVAFSPDGKYVLAGSQDNAARLWDPVAGRLIRSFPGHSKPVNAVAFSPDGKYIATGSDDSTARIWDVATGQPLRVFQGGIGGVATVAYSPDGRQFLTTTGYPSITGSGPGEEQTIVWDVSTGRRIQTIPIGPGLYYGQLSQIAAFSPDGKRLLIAGWKFSSHLVDVASGREICSLLGHSDSIVSVAFSRDGRYLLTASVDKTARLWDARTCQQLRLFTDNSSIMTSAVFSPDGRYVLTGQSDNTAHLWDAASGSDLRQFSGHTGKVNGVAFSPDGRYAVTGGQDGTVRLWDVDYHDTLRFACGLLWRDLTPQERTQFNIADDQPTCPPSTTPAASLLQRSSAAP
jgi:WD40 repeat protein